MIFALELIPQKYVKQIGFTSKDGGLADEKWDLTNKTWD